MAMGHPPYPYQEALVSGADWPLVLEVPTGMGKTAAVVLGWIWRRRFASPECRADTPRRLIYCLPQRTLVRQTMANIESWLQQVGLGPHGSQRNETLDTSHEPSVDAKHLEIADGVSDGRRESRSAWIPVYGLLGGDVAGEFDVEPEYDAILVGTQDQLLSRALFRGYGLSRSRWPMHAAFVNNDCLWVVDEPQLMSTGLATTAQLQAFRDGFGTYGPAKTLWMSATFREEWLATVDYTQTVASSTILRLSAEDKICAGDKLEADKPCTMAPIKVAAGEASGKGLAAYVERLRDFVLVNHRPETVTLVICNRVQRAQDLYVALEKAGRPKEQMVLVHSRFRMEDRDGLNAVLRDLSGRDVIVVATQAVEAGIDMSAETLITELAPWTSMVQRFGRCNRYGECRHPSVHIVDVELHADACSPYQVADVQEARNKLVNLRNVRIVDLPPVDGGADATKVIRRKDLLQLFDTSPDLSGLDIDISPYIRDAEDADVQVYWRLFSEDSPSPEMSRPSGREICRVSRSMFREYLKNKHKGQLRKAWTWNFATESWQEVNGDTAYPGQTILLNALWGGYTPELGFVAKNWNTVPTPSAKEDLGQMDAESRESDNMASHVRVPVELADHTKHVVDQAKLLQKAFSDVPLMKAVVEAALLHDWGKSHEAFQMKLKAGLDAASPWQSVLLAKSGNWSTGNKLSQIMGGVSVEERHSAGTSPNRGTELPPESRTISPKRMRAFRHELASALAYLVSTSSNTAADMRYRRLVAYLIAAHHGKVRVTIRSLPNEEVPTAKMPTGLPQDERMASPPLFARGVWEGDTLPEFSPDSHMVLAPVELSLRWMTLGRVWPSGEAVGESSVEDEPSWLEGVLALLHDLGPFRLAWLETILRVADWRASAAEGGETK
jgi:CRISPR-associated endonuclease/helicase Cas3